MAAASGESWKRHIHQDYAKIRDRVADFANDSEANQLAVLAQLSANRTYVLHPNRLMYGAVYLAALGLFIASISNANGALRVLIPIRVEDLPDFIAIILAWVWVAIMVAAVVYGVIYHLRMIRWGRFEAGRISRASTWFDLYTAERERRFADRSPEAETWRSARAIRWE